MSQQRISFFTKLKWTAQSRPHGCVPFAYTAVFHKVAASFQSPMIFSFTILGEREFPSSQLPDNRTIESFVEAYVDEYVG